MYVVIGVNRLRFDDAVLLENKEGAWHGGLIGLNKEFDFYSADLIGSRSGTSLSLDYGESHSRANKADERRGLT